MSLALPTRKAHALLAYLAMPLGVSHPRDRLAGLLWGNAVGTTARTSLRQTLYALRKTLSRRCVFVASQRNSKPAASRSARLQCLARCNRDAQSAAAAR